MGDNLANVKLDEVYGKDQKHTLCYVPFPPTKILKLYIFCLGVEQNLEEDHVGDEITEERKE